MQRLAFKNMSKAYGGVPALSEVSLELTAGRAHALMGENGAGKSTLIKLIAGAVRADSISLQKDGVGLPLSSPMDAYRAGFRVIHQELNIVPQVSVAENILLGRRYPRRFGLAVDWRGVKAWAQAALDELGATHIDVSALAGDLSAGDRMLMRIAAALVREREQAEEEEVNADLFVLDEPTAALSGAESEMLFSVIERLKARGAAVLYVSHRIDEVLRICDDITVLRDGRHVSTGTIEDTTKDEIIHAMTGREVRDTYPPRIDAAGARIVAELRDVATPSLTGLNLSIGAGEVMGVTGLSDSGQREFLRLFLGLEPPVRGDAHYDGAPLPRNPSEAWKRGVAYIPRERRGEALMLDMPVRSNIVLPHLGSYGLRAQKRAEGRDAHRLGEQVRLKCERLEQPVSQLSGGNQQKVVFARALQGNPKLLLLDEPTRGVDVGAKFDIYTLVRKLSAQGCSVILTSTDLPEVLGMCDRILVLHDGQQAHLLDRASMTSADLLSHFYPAVTV